MRLPQIVTRLTPAASTASPAVCHGRRTPSPAVASVQLTDWNSHTSLYSDTTDITVASSSMTSPLAWLSLKEPRGLDENELKSHLTDTVAQVTASCKSEVKHMLRWTLCLYTTTYRSRYVIHLITIVVSVLTTTATSHKFVVDNLWRWVEVIFGHLPLGKYPHRQELPVLFNRPKKPKNCFFPLGWSATYRHTERPCYSVCSNGPHAAVAAMRPVKQVDALNK